jgi:hypothetical protein
MTPTWTSAVVVLSVVGSLFRAAPGAGAGASLLVRAQPASAPFQLPLPAPEERLQGEATVVGNLTPSQCRAKLAQSTGHEAFASLGARNGIALPMQVVGPVLGIDFKVPPKKSAYGNLDCRQALLWLHLAPVLSEHGVVGIAIDNFYRNRARVKPGRKSQHAYGLAADVTAVIFGGEALPEESKTGASLPSGAGRADVERDFLGKLGEPVCGPEARIVPAADSDAEQIARAVRLRNLVCDLARRGAFHHILTPNYNLAHRNHLHLDIQRDNKWFSVQ